MKQLLLPTILAAGLMISGSAEAIDLTYTGMSLPNAATASISVNGSSFRSVYAGQINFSSSNGSLSTYCGEALATLNGASNRYDVSQLTLTPNTNLGKAGTILANNQAGAITAAQQAGLQLAVWEAIYDGGATFDASNAGFKAKNVSSEILGFASQYYATFSTTPTNSVTFFGSTGAGGQSQMTAVPEPMTVAALGMGSLALLRRRRKSA
jgi:hypothetical protein